MSLQIPATDQHYVGLDAQKAMRFQRSGPSLNGRAQPLKIPTLTHRASALWNFVFDSFVGRAAEAAADRKDSEELLRELGGLEKHDLTMRIDKTW